ncbi:transcriptional regulator [Bacillus toyonensis]|nr:transcriptional regulator [Bacillus toyonensis]
MWVYRKDLELSNEEINQETGVAVDELEQELVRVGLISIKKELNRAVDLYVNRYKLGLTMDEIAEKEFISKSTLYAELKNRGIDCKSIGRTYKQEDLNLAVSLFLTREERGLLVRDILQKTGVPHSVLYKELKKRNIDCNESNQSAINSAIDLYTNRKATGIKVLDILERTKISSQTFYKELKLRGIPLRGRSKKQVA